MNVTEPIRRTARLTPDAIAIVTADHGTMSYAALDRGIDRMAIHASGLGLRAGDVAGLSILPPHEAPALILALGLARIGVATAEPSLGDDLMRLCFQATGPGRPAGPGLVGFDASWLDDAAPVGNRPELSVHPDGNLPLRICASSGTTGRPKHFALTHDLVGRRIHRFWLALGAGPVTRMIAVGLGSSLGFVTMLRTFWQGGTVVLFDPRSAATAIQRHAVTTIVTSPIALRTILDTLPPGATGPLPTLASIEVPGSVMPPPLREAAVARLCPNVLSCLGSSEAGGIAAAPLAALSARPSAVGYLYPGVRAEAVTADHVPLPMGEEGILRIRSDTIVAGYVGEADGSDGFRDGWFYPGDVGTVWPDGMLSLTGRATELINSGGVKISPDVVEAWLLELPGVTDAAAFGVPGASGLPDLWAAIVTTAPISDDVLADYCDRAPPGQAPEIMLQVEAIPRNANGKIDRAALVAAGRQMMDAAGEG